MLRIVSATKKLVQLTLSGAVVAWGGFTAAELTAAELNSTPAPVPASVLLAMNDGENENIPPQDSDTGEEISNESNESDESDEEEKCTGLKIGGSVTAGIWANSHGTTGGILKDTAADSWVSFGDAGNGEPLTTLQNTGVQLNAAEFWAEYTYYGCNGGFIGGRADVIFGTDARYYQSYGGLDWLWGEGQYGVALAQAYGLIGYENLAVKIGKFYTPFYNEADEFFYSHGYSWNQVPMTHMGVMAEYQLGERVTLYGGWAKGWDTYWGADDDSGSKDDSCGIFGILYNINDKISLAYYASIGTIYQGCDNYTHSLVFNYLITDRFSYNFEFLYTSYDEGDEIVYGFNNIFLYDITEKIALGLRLEYERSEITGDQPSEAFNATCGISWKPMGENLSIRPEIRYDTMKGDIYPFKNGTDKNQLSGGIAVSYEF